MVHSHDVTMFSNQDKDIRTFFWVSKFDTWKIKWCIYGITHLEITYVSVTCKPLQGESGKANSLSTYYPRCVQGRNEQNNEN